MRGLIYKECSLFLKSIGKKEAALVAVLAVLDRKSVVWERV